MTSAEIRTLLQRPIAFQRSFAWLTGDVKAALLLSQAFYWQDRCERDFFYKTAQEWTEETGLSYEEQSHARGILRRHKFWREEKRGIPCRLHYSVDFEELAASLTHLSSIRQSPKLEPSKAVDKAQEKPQESQDKSLALSTKTTPKRKEEAALILEKMATDLAISKSTHPRPTPSEVLERGKRLGMAPDAIEAFYRAYDPAWRDSGGQPIRDWEKLLNKVALNHRIARS